jgi:hypothetical protein
LYTFLFSVVGGRTHYLARTAPLGLNWPNGLLVGGFPTDLRPAGSSAWPLLQNWLDVSLRSGSVPNSNGDHTCARP